MLKKDFSFGTSIATVKVHLEIRQFLEFIMNHEVSNTALKTINTVMMWLFCLTVLMLIVPWQAVSTEFADRIESNKIFLYFALIIEISNFISQAVVSGKFELLEHEAAKWLDKDSLDSVAWLPADLGLVDKLKDYLSKNRS